MDAVELTQALVRCPSVTPEEGGALQLLEARLTAAGFACWRVDRGGTPNLYARVGPRDVRTFGFNGHTDVVPVGDADAWTVDPFGAEIRDGWLYGRGATDMKSGVAAFVAAAAEVAGRLPPDAAIALAITGDEEGSSVDGTPALVDWMRAEGERMDACIVGEPTCPETMGDMVKIGRRGSMSAWVTLRGKQGHAAYPLKALNPMPALLALATRLEARVLDAGTEHFDPSNLEITSIDTGNSATNVIPAAVRLALNIRFNDKHTGADLAAWIAAEAQAVAAETGVRAEVTHQISGEAFLTPPGALSDLVAGAVARETNVTPVLSTTGGTSDARYMKDVCPVVEFGLVGHRMHEVDERVRVDDIRTLARVYTRILDDYFA